MLLLNRSDVNHCISFNKWNEVSGWGLVSSNVLKIVLCIQIYFVKCLKCEFCCVHDCEIKWNINSFTNRILESFEKNKSLDLSRCNFSNRVTDFNLYSIIKELPT